MRHGYEDWDSTSDRAGTALSRLVPEPLFHYRVSQTGIQNRFRVRGWHVVGDIQDRNAKPTVGRTIRGLWTWRASRVDILARLYFFWLILHRSLPTRIFAMLFRT
jgi:hypothetical protein